MENYTLRELFDRLKIPIAELGRRAGISEVTVAKIRDGASARRSSINRLLEVFSDLYGVELTLQNVTGILIKDKLARLEAEEAIEPLVSAPVVQPRAISEKPQKRMYTPRETELPEGCILASDFATKHGVPRPTFINHMLIGLGPGTVAGEQADPVMVVKDHVEYSERVKPGRKRKTADGRVIEEKEKYLTQEQQSAALDFWRRHGVPFQMPEIEKEHAQ